jgi:hypothetical protein
MPTNGYFSSERDKAIMDAGGFFCEACLVGKAASEASPDPRYCQRCYDFLLKEAEVLSESGSTRRPGWIPKPQKAQENQCPIPSPGASIMATVESPKIKVAIITPRDATRTIIKRGPKHRVDLPVEFILKWAGEGMGSKKITAKLKAEYDITVGFRTIARILSGQRLLV